MLGAFGSFKMKLRLKGCQMPKGGGAERHSSYTLEYELVCEKLQMSYN